MALKNKYYHLMFVLLISVPLISQTKKDENKVYWCCTEDIIKKQGEYAKNIRFKISDSLVVINNYFLDSARINDTFLKKELLDSIGQKVFWQELIFGLKKNNKIGINNYKKITRKIIKINSKNKNIKCTYLISFSRIIFSEEKTHAALIIHKTSDCLVNYLEICILENKKNESWRILDNIKLK